MITVFHRVISEINRVSLYTSTPLASWASAPSVLLNLMTMYRPRGYLIVSNIDHEWNYPSRTIRIARRKKALQGAHYTISCGQECPGMTAQWPLTPTVLWRQGPCWVRSWGPIMHHKQTAGVFFKAYLTFFKKVFFFFGCGPLFKSLLNLLQYSLFYVLVFSAMRLVGAYLSDQGWNAHPRTGRQTQPLDCQGNPQTMCI